MLFYSTAQNQEVWVYPKYRVGDVLWVRETWERLNCCSCEGDERGDCAFTPNENDACYLYRADDTELLGDARWRPSIHMPRDATRLFLRVTDVRAEQLQKISRDNCLEEGAPTPCRDIGYHGEYCNCIDWYTNLWNSLYAKRGYGWGTNPWVWVYTFERCDNPMGNKKCVNCFYGNEPYCTKDGIQAEPAKLGICDGWKAKDLTT